MMDWTQVLVIIGANAIVHLFMLCMLRSDRKEIAFEMREFREKWAEETKDFHARLYNLEERYKIKHEKHQG